jgi:Xaa-Pro aminopeptidase
MPGRWQAFPTSEFETRMANVQSAMHDQRIDLLLLHAPENIYYLTGYQTCGYFAYQMLAVPPRGTPVLLVRYLERGNIHEYSWLEAYETWKEGDDVAIRSVEVIKKVGAEDARIGIEKSGWFLTLDVADACAPPCRASPGRTPVSSSRRFASSNPSASCPTSQGREPSPRPRCAPPWRCCAMA